MQGHGSLEGIIHDSLPRVILLHARTPTADVPDGTQHGADHVQLMQQVKGSAL